MIITYAGELAALLTAFFWTVTAISFESAGKKIGSLSVNLIRLFFAFVFIGLLSLVTQGQFFPLGASVHNWIWLSVSGFVGFVLGDMLLFRAYIVVGARVSMLIMSLSPPLAAVAGWLILGETMDARSIAGMAVTIGGISMVILKRERNNIENGPTGQINKKRRNSYKFSYPVTGVLLALGGAAGQATGLVLSKYGMEDYNPFQANQIRMITGFFGFAMIFTILRRWNRLVPALKNRQGMSWLTLGAFFGPFLGASFSLVAVKYTASGIAATIMSLVPVIIIAPAVIIFKEKVTPVEIAGAIIAFLGVAMFFM